MRPAGLEHIVNTTLADKVDILNKDSPMTLISSSSSLLEEVESKIDLDMDSSKPAITYHGPVPVPVPVFPIDSIPADLDSDAQLSFGRVRAHSISGCVQYIGKSSIYNLKAE
jgi:hypothetical protein